MCLDHPETSEVHGKIVFHDTGPGAEGWGPLLGCVVQYILQAQWI